MGWRAFNLRDRRRGEPFMLAVMCRARAGAVVYAGRVTPQARNPASPRLFPTVSFLAR